MRSRERAAKEVQEIESRGGTCLELDITNAKACFDVFAQAEKLYGQVDVLINNAGMAYLGVIEHFTYVPPGRCGRPLTDAVQRRRGPSSNGGQLLRASAVDTSSDTRLQEAANRRHC